MNRLANTPMPHVTNQEHSVLDMFRHQNMSNALHRPIPAPEPNPEPNPGPDATLYMFHSRIAPDDWNDLFYAVQTRLENCIGEGSPRTPELMLKDPQKAIKTTVRECVMTMQQLQAALNCERSERQAR